MSLALLCLLAQTMSQPPDAELFWSPDPVAALERAVPAKDGLEVFAPSGVDLETRTSVPVVLRRKGTLAESARSPLRRFAVVLVLDLGADEAFAGPAVLPRGEERPFRVPDEATLAGMAPGLTTEQVVLDLRGVLPLPWRPAELLVLAVARRLRSEPVRISLRGRGQPAAVALEAEIQPASREGASRAPGAGAGTGLALRVDPKARRLEVTCEPAGKGDVHLLFVGTKHPAPTLFRLRARSGEESLSVDLAALPLGAEPYTIWAVARGAVAGPVEVP